MKKLLIISGLTMAIMSMFVGCSNKEETVGPNYTVVEMGKGFEIEKVFEFQSTVNTVISNYQDNSVEEGVYRAGILSNGHSVLWRTDIDTGLFVYVEGKVVNAQIPKYVAKLKESAISYEEFQQIYNR